MRHGNNKEILKCKLLGTRRLGRFINDYSQPILLNDVIRQEYLSIHIASYWTII